MRTLLLILSIISCVLTSPSQAQIWKKKDKDASSDTTRQEEKAEKGGGSFFQKVISKAAKGAAKLSGSVTGTTKSTGDLQVVEPSLFVMSNLLPKEIGTMDMDFFTDWKKGGDMMGVMFLPKDKSFFYKIDGDVKIDGKESNYQSTGLYSKVLEPGTQSRLIEIQTKTGQKASFNLVPNKNMVKLASINNKTTNCEIDITKDFTIQLENYSSRPGALVDVRIVAQTLGLRAFYPVGYFKAASSITIPGYILKHISTSNKGMSYKNCYLAVDDASVLEAKDESGAYKEPIRYIAMSSSALPVTLSANPVLFEGFTVEGADSYPLGKMDYLFKRPNAYGSRPLEHIKKIAAITVSLSGTTYYYDRKEKKLMDMKMIQEKTIEFPQIPDEKLNALLETFYSQITEILKDEFQATILPASTVTGTREYKDIAPFTKTEANTKEHFSKSYQGLRQLPNMLPLAITTSGTPALFKAAGANALLKASLDLQISYDNKPVLAPILTIELLGEKNGGEIGYLPTQYFTATLKGNGYVLTKKTIITDQVINDIVRIDDLLASFKKGLKELKAREASNGEYAPIWKLQN